MAPNLPQSPPDGDTTLDFGYVVPPIPRVTNTDYANTSDYEEKQRKARESKAHFDAFIRASWSPSSRRRGRR